LAKAGAAVGGSPAKLSHWSAWLASYSQLIATVLSPLLRFTLSS